MVDAPVSPVTPNAPGSGIQPVVPPESAKFTQEQLDAVINERLKREREKYADFDALKKKAGDFDALTAAQKTDLEKANDRALKAEQERDQAMKTSQERLIMAEFKAEAAKLDAKFPSDAYALADRSAVTIDAVGNVTGVDKAVEAIVKDGRLPVKTTARPPDINAANQGGAGKLTADELRQKKIATGMYSKM